MFQVDTDRVRRRRDEIRKQAVAARIRADRLESWTTAVYNLVKFRLAWSRASVGGQTQLAAGPDVQRLIGMILNAAIAVTEADFGNVQLVDRPGGVLRIVAQQGFDEPFLDYFRTVDHGTAACGTALRARNRIVVPDVKTSPVFSASARTVMLNASARAVQSTPVLDRDASVVAIVSTHFQRPHEPSERQLRFLDALVRSACPVFKYALEQSSQA